MRFSTLPKSIAIVALALFSSGAFAQNQPNQIALWLQSFEASHQVQTVSVLEHTELASRALPTEDADYLTLDNDQLASLFENKPAVIDFVIPRNGGTVNLTLARVNITSDDFSVNTNDESNVAYKNGVHYRGIVNGDENSIAALSFYDGEVMGFYNNAQGNYTVGKVEGEQEVMVVYNSKQLENPEAWGCFTADSGAPVEYTNDGNDNRGIGCKTVKVYFECDYALFTNKGSSTTNVSNYVTGLFNQVATLYANENVDIQISEIYVWTTTDPYVSHTSTSAVLSAFKANKGTNFNGNLAHFLTTRSLGGGIAYVDVICSKSYAFGVSAISSSYNSVPTYSWTIEVVTHELGHNLGSPHTQSCSWTGGALDNCYAVEGSCSPGPAPINGGTIMSYCHMTSTGINFNNGFGSQPGNLIRSRVLNATCLTSSGTAPTGLTTTNIATEAAVLTWVAVPGATQYTVQYKPAASSTWITAGNTAGISYSLSGLSAGTDYNWQVKTDCSAYAAAASFATTTNTVIPTCANVTGLFATNVGTSSASLSWSAVSGATDYTVQYKTSLSSTWGTLGTYAGTSTSISGLASNTVYNWQVKASCATGYSSVSSFTTSAPVSTVCGPPTGLTSTNIFTNKATLNWAAVPGATSYSIKYRRVGTTSWTNVSNVTTTSRTVLNLLAGQTYEWRVKSSCYGSFSSTVSFVTPAAMAGMIEAAGTPVTSLHLYPNPAQHQLQLTINGWEANETGTAQFFNVTGVLVSAFGVEAEENTMSISALPAGVYFIHVTGENNEPAVTRFIKN